MTRENVTQQIIKQRLVAIVRLAEQRYVADTLSCLVEGGVKVLEITSNTPGYLDEISRGRSDYNSTLIGAGTVINGQIAEDAVKAGAQFLVTPNVSQAVAEVAHHHDIPVLMGAMTPTEIVTAMELGADVIKLFPAGELGIEYYKGLQGPFDKTSFFAVGGIHKENVQLWLNSGIAGVGVGNTLTRAINNEDEKRAHTEYVRQFVSLITPDASL